MRLYLLICFFLISQFTRGYINPARYADRPNGQNVFIVTLDGMRWQELFGGADAILLNDASVTHDTAALKKYYWDDDLEARRRKLMPFFWNTIAAEGQLMGNRHYGNKVDVANFYRLSYPGYNEILTGKTDLKIFSNDRTTNRNETFLEYINSIKPYNGKVAAFASWNLFSFILNEKKSGVPVNCGPKDNSWKTFKSLCAAIKPRPKFYDDNQNTRNDWITFFAARQYILQHLPKVFFLGLGGTDEYGHQKKYGHYLLQATQADKIIEQLWNLLQSLPYYKGKTTLIVTTDHGRGAAAANWHHHGFLTEGSSQTWIAMLGKGVDHLGEHQHRAQLYQQQLAGTVGNLLGIRSFSNHSIPASYYTACNSTF